MFDALGVKPGYRVADIGCGFGYFTFRLAARVGSEGTVYAVDIDPKAIDRVRQRKEREKLAQVEPILGESNDPRLPGDLDSVLIVDTYHEFRDWDRMMRAVFRVLKEGGRLVIIDGEGPPGSLVLNTTDFTRSRTRLCAKKWLATGLSSKGAGLGSMTPSTASGD